MIHRELYEKPWKDGNKPACGVRYMPYKEY